MARYYALVAGLPNIGAEDRKLPISIEHFLEQTSEELTPADARLLRNLRLEEEHPQVIAFIEKCTASDLKGDPEEVDLPENKLRLLDPRALLMGIAQAQTQGTIAKKNPLPDYLKAYLAYRFMDPEEAEEAKTFEDGTPKSESLLRLEEDRLAAFYYRSMMKSKNKFCAQWAELNLNIKNVLALYTLRHLGWDAEQYIVGDNLIAQKLREAKGKDLGITAQELPLLPRITAIAEETDIARRERLIDVLRWDWLEEQTFFKPFDVEVLLSYYLQLSIIERWLSLNEKTGEETFRRIVKDLKKQSTGALQEFKRKQKK